MSTTEEILESALTLSQRDRAALALQLLESLDDRHLGASDEDFAAELARRCDEVRTGRVTPVDGRAAISEIRNGLRR
jgi:putative addiction module component (TIGR02574 family)